MFERDDEPLIAGWHEPAALLGLGLEQVYAKLDTGSDRSSVHAREIHISRDQSFVDFAAPLLHVQRDCTRAPSGGLRQVRAELVDLRLVKSSNGAEELRPVISTPLILGPLSFVARLSLCNRSGMRFCVLLGRDSLHGRFLVDSSRAHLLEGEPGPHSLVGCF